MYLVSSLEYEKDAQRILSEATTLIADVYLIKHSTIQIERYVEAHETERIA